MSGGWSFAGRFTRLALLGTVAIVATSAGLGWWFLSGAVAREVDALINEELEEMHAHFEVSDQGLESFQEIASRLSNSHPTNPMGWRVVRPDGTPWAEHGSARLIAATTSESELPARTHRAARELTNELTVTLVLDANSQYAELSRYGRASLVLLIGLGVVASLGSALFCRSVGRRLQNVADWIRDQADVSGELSAASEDERAPNEILDITRALRQLLHVVRTERERANLLMAGLAHELRSPIQNLQGQAEIALLRERDDEEYRDVLASQLEELRRFARVVDNFVTLCASDDAANTRLESFDVGDEARLRLAAAAERGRREGIQFDLQCRGDLHFRGDREAILLALGNIVGNALDWTPRGASVQVLLEGSGAGVRFTVDDSGPGVPASERSRIFEPFYHGPSPNGSRVGFGLGLALTRVAVQHHGGQVEVSDSPLGGARFEVTLPSSPPAPSSPATMQDDLEQPTPT